MKNILLILLALLVMVSASHAQPAFEHRSLEEALNPDGTLKRGVQGSFKVDGYQMRTGANGEPIFLPQTQNTTTGTWDTQFGLPGSGVAGVVNAFAFDGQGNVYVGGVFGAVGGVSTAVNYVVRYNVQTNSWSTLGTDTSNGVRVGNGVSLGIVNALAIDRQGRLYVGGTFLQAGGVSANGVARFDPTTNTWSALGTGTQNGVSGTVNALAIDGSGRVVAGGLFASAGGVPSTFIARWTSGASRVEQISTNMPRTFLLEQNYPNPFNPSTTIRYQLPVASEVKLEVYDVLGKKVATLVSERQAAGYYQYVWNANGLASGVYVYRLQADQFVQTRKMMLVK